MCAWVKGSINRTRVPVPAQWPALPAEAELAIQLIAMRMDDRPWAAVGARGIV